MYIIPSIQKRVFTCPHCKGNNQMSSLSVGGTPLVDGFTGYTAKECTVCKDISIFVTDYSFNGGISRLVSEKLIYPTVSHYGNEPNDDMPISAKEAFNEARSIASLSPRGAINVMRVAAEIICKDLGAEGKVLNAMIIDLIKKKEIIDEESLENFELTRLFGNEGSHDSDEAPTIEDFESITMLLNLIVDDFYTKRKKRQEFLSKFQSKSDSIQQKKNLLENVQDQD